MPIFEFYCPDCHTVFSFLVRGEVADGHPECPVCSRPGLEKRPSSFAIGSSAGETDPEGQSLESTEEARLGGAMTNLAKAMSELGQGQDTGALSRAFRRFGKDSGLDVGPQLEDALLRMDRGEDLETIERELDASDSTLQDLFRLRRSHTKSVAPRIDDTLYFLD